MGNIISNEDGSLSGNNSALKRNMTEILFNLDLYNTGKYYSRDIDVDTNRANGAQPRGPRVEYDYSKAGTSPTRSSYTSTNLDTNDVGRKTNSSGNYIDIDGIPYSDASYVSDNSVSGSTLYATKNGYEISKDGDKTALTSNKFYNVKRGFCNASLQVPIDIIGVDLPVNNPDVMSLLNSLPLTPSGLRQTNPVQQNAIINEQISIYKYSQTMDDDINKCLKYGTLDPARQVEPGAISEVFNLDGSLATQTTLNDLAGSNAYGNKLSKSTDNTQYQGCTELLSKTLINSYISPNLKEYSLLKNNPTITDNLSLASFGLLFDTNTKSNRVVPINADGTVPGNTNVRQTESLYGVKNFAGSANAGGVLLTDLDQIYSNNIGCNTLAADICNYYYYYDINDGVIHNPGISRMPVDGTDLNRFAPNIQFLNQHIPDCRCMNLPNLISKFDGSSDTDYYNQNYTDNHCLSSANFGESNSWISGANINPVGTSVTSLAVSMISSISNGISKLYNSATERTENVAYRRQIDPTIYTTTPLKGDGKFMFVPKGARTATIRKTTITCTVQNFIKISEVAGDVIVNGVKAICNINVPPPGGGSGSGDSSSTAGRTPSPASGGGSDTTIGGSITGGGNSVDGISINKCTYNNGITPIETNDPPFNYGDVFKVWLNFASTSTETLIQQNFISNYQFSLCLSTNMAQKIVLPLPSSNCLGNSGSSSTIQSKCYSPYKLRTPFLYGPETNAVGIPYKLVFESAPDGGNTIRAIVGCNVMKLKQYSMRISYIEVDINNSVPTINIGINMNTIDSFAESTNNQLRAQVILKPIDTRQPTIYKAFSDLQETIRSNGSLSLVGTGDGNIPIRQIKYNYSIILNGISDGNSEDSGGYTMLYDQSMPLVKQGIIDLSQTQSFFNTFMVSYVDYDDNNSVNLLLNNDTAKLGSTLVVSWQFNSIDSSDNKIDLYYDTNLNYNKDSSTAVKIGSNISSSINTFRFMCPILSSPIIIYGVYPSLGSSIPPIININVTSSVNRFRNWEIIRGRSQSRSSLPNKLILASNIDKSITNYIDLNNNTSSYRYKYIIYDPGTSGINSDWYGSNDDLTSTALTTMTIFKNPNSILPVPNISITKINDISISSSSAATNVLFGSTLNLTYASNFPFNTDIQVMIGDPINRAQQTTIYSFTVSQGPKSDTISFTVFYDITINKTNLNLYLISYGSFISTLVPINITNNIIPVSLPGNKVITQNLTRPLLCINSILNDSVISKMNITYTTTFTDNKYYTLLNGFNSPLSILQTSINVGAINLNLPLVIVLAVSGSINALLSPSSFTNVTIGKKNKNLESFYGNLLTEHLSGITSSNENEIHLDTIEIDLSNSTISPIINIQLKYSGYTRIYIQNLILLFGNNRLDSTKFNINFTSDDTSTIYYQISSITIIGSLTTSGYVVLLKTVPGLTNLNYSSTRKLSDGNYALIKPLDYDYLNGYYKKPPTYDDDLARKLSEYVNDKPPLLKQAANPTSAASLSLTEIILTILGTLGIIGICVYIYFKFIKKQS
jgi:hypothetical protein